MAARCLLIFASCVAATGWKQWDGATVGFSAGLCGTPGCGGSYTKKYNVEACENIGYSLVNGQVQAPAVLPWPFGQGAQPALNECSNPGELREDTCPNILRFADLWTPTVDGRTFNGIGDQRLIQGFGHAFTKMADNLPCGFCAACRAKRVLTDGGYNYMLIMRVDVTDDISPEVDEVTAAFGTGVVQFPAADRIPYEYKIVSCETGQEVSTSTPTSAPSVVPTTAPLPTTTPTSTPALTPVPTPAPAVTPKPAPTPVPALAPTPAPAVSPKPAPAPVQTCSAVPNNGRGATDSNCAPCATGQQHWPCDSPSFQWDLCLCSGSDGASPIPSSAPSPTPNPMCTAVHNNAFGVTDASCLPCASGQEYWPCDSNAYQWNLCICEDGFTKLVQRAAIDSTVNRHGSMGHADHTPGGLVAEEIVHSQRVTEDFPQEQAFLSPIRGSV